MEQEISLREIIEIVLKGKWFIVAVTLVLVLIVGVVSFFVIDPTYEARVTISVNTKDAEGSSPSLAKYIEQVKSHMVMRQTIDELSLSKNGVTINSLRDQIRTEIIKDTNLIRIYVKDSDKEQASLIANVVTAYFIDFIKNQEKEQLLELMTYEIDSLDSALTVKRQSLDTLQSDLATTPMFYEVSKSVAQDSLLHSVVTEQLNGTSSEAGAIQYSEEVLNPVFEKLQSSVTSLQIEIQDLESKRAELQKNIADKKTL